MSVATRDFLAKEAGVAFALGANESLSRDHVVFILAFPGPYSAFQINLDLEIQMNSAKLQAFASIAEVVSAIAVVVTLLYVSSELKRAGTMDNRDADLVLYQRIQEAHRQIIETPQLAELVVTASTEPQALTHGDRVRYLAYQDDFFNSWEIAFSYYADGILGDDLWQEWDKWFVEEARRRPKLGWVENRQNYTGEAFRQHVDSLLIR